MSNDKSTRRSLLQFLLGGTAAAGVAEVLQPFAFTEDANVPLERAAVCIYLIGGNDSNNMVVPLDAAGYSNYASGRGTLALADHSLLPIMAPRQKAATFGFHGSLNEVQDLYQRKVLAVLANTGLLNAPLTREAAQNAGALPANLFHHESATYAAYLRNASILPPWAPGIQDQDPKDPSAQVFNIDGVSMLSPRRLSISGGLQNNPNILHAMKGLRVRTPFPETGIGTSLRRIAGLLLASSKLGIRQPVFSATMAGFDTHYDQLTKQAQLFTDLSQAMGAFYAATEEIGLASQVVTFTQTEFNRALQPNKFGGSEHGWGGHELIMGASVRGGDIFGTFPSLEVGGPDDMGSSGIWVPTTANQQYGTSIARWFGAGEVSAANGGSQNFPAGDVGFLG